MRRIPIFSVWLALLLVGNLVRGQQSANTVKYTVDYNAVTQTYTAYAVPDYNTPNGNNSLPTERGATAQFSIVVPSDFVITQVTDIRGTWAKADELLKLGPGQPNQDWTGYGLNPNLNYYTIGKAATETDYGPFVIGQRVALFSFRGNGCFGPISPLPPGDPFINAADQAFALNVGNSFSSRSGQPAGGNQQPLEQFVNVTGSPASCAAVPGPVLTAIPDNTTVVAGSPATTLVLANDTNTGAPASVSNVTVSIATAPTVGTVVIGADGSITYTAPTGFTGVACYTYRICDITSTTACATAQVCVTVNPAPVVRSVTASPDNTTTVAGSPATTLVLANDTNTGAPASVSNVTVSIATPPTVGTAVINADGSITYTAPTGFTGVACYTYRICDLTSTTACATAQVCVTVNPVPVVRSVTASPDNTTTVAGSPATTLVLANDTNTGAPASVSNVTVSIATPPTVGTAVIGADGSITYTAPTGFTGVACYTYRICDLTSTTACATAQVCVTVNPVPVVRSVTASPDNTTTVAGSPATTLVLANDTNTGAPASVSNVTVSIATPPTVGTAVIGADGSITYTAPTGFTGVACYTYRICDLTSTTACATAQVCVTVNPVPVVRSVTASPDNTTTVAGSPATTLVLANDTNTGAPASVSNVTVSIATAPTVGTAVIGADGSITYTAPTGFTGVACYTYRICDLTSTTACATAQVCVTVAPLLPGVADVSVTKVVVGDKVRALNDVVTFNVIVKNLGADAVTNLVVKDSLDATLQFQSATTTAGTFAASLLTIPALAAGDSVVLTVTAKLIGEGIAFNYARVVSQSQTDPNAANNSDQTCVSVPINVCSGEGVVATVPATLTNVNWFRDGQPAGAGNTITFTQSGRYTFTASNSTCPAEGCCPLIIVQQECCPVDVCVPFVITKTRRR